MKYSGPQQSFPEKPWQLIISVHTNTVIERPSESIESLQHASCLSSSPSWQCMRRWSKRLESCWWWHGGSAWEPSSTSYWPYFHSKLTSMISRSRSAMAPIPSTSGNYSRSLMASLRWLAFTWPCFCAVVLKTSTKSRSFFTLGHLLSCWSTKSLIASTCQWACYSSTQWSATRFSLYI